MTASDGRAGGGRSKQMKHKLRYSREKLYHNCLYVMSAHMAAMCRLFIVSHEISWYDISYSFQSRSNTDGTLSYDRENGILVGALRKNNSQRILDYPAKNALDYFGDADEHVVELAKGLTLRYLLLDFEEREKKRFFGTKVRHFTQPVVTTVFWSEGDDIFSPDDEASFIEHGGKYIDELSVSKAELTDFVVENYELEDDELAFAEGLFRLKLQDGTRLDAKALAPYAPYVGTEGYDYLMDALSGFGFTVTP
jgi:hypothetical protein